MRRWTIRIIGGIVLLLLALAATIQIILWTDLPRRWILRILNGQSGLVVDAESISVTWTGRTTVRGVAVRLPLDREELFSVDTLELSHRSIPGLILWRSLGLESVRIRQPQLYLQRGIDGRWNVPDAVSDLMWGAGGGPDLTSIQLPRVNVEGASIHITDPNGGNTTIGPLSFEGIQRTGPSWGFALASGPASSGSTEPAVEVRGTLIENEECSHAADFRIEPNDSWVTAISGRDLGSIHLIGHWDGRIRKSSPSAGSGQALAGAVRLDRLNAGPVTLTGTARIAQQPDGVEIDPDHMVLEMPALRGKQVLFTGGSIATTGRLIEFEHVGSEMAALGAQLSGRWNLDTESGELTASWAASLPGQGEHNGVCQVTIQSPSVGRKEARLSTTAAGQGALGSWRLVAQTQGTGASWGQSRWRTSIQECTWLWKSQQMKLDGASATIAMDWPAVRLIDLALPGASPLQATAQYDASKRSWFARLNGQGLRLLKEQTEGLDVRLDAEGADQSVTLSEFRVTQGEKSFAAKGQLALPSYEIQKGHVQARWPQTAAEPQDGQKAPTPGQWSCDANIAGPVSPLKLLIKATVTGTDVAVGRRTAPKLEILLRGDIDSGQIAIATDPFRLFGGLWQARGQYQLFEPLTHLDATVEDLPVQAAAEMAGLGIKCEGSAKAQIQLSVPNLNMKQSRARGTWDVSRLQVSPVRAQQAHGRLLIGGGIVQFDDIELTQDAGKAQGGLHFALDQPHRLFISFATSKWPLQLQARPLAVLVDSKAEIQLDIAKKSTDGRGWFSGQLLCGDQILGQTGASLAISNGTLQVNDLKGDLLGGTIEGSATIPLSQWTSGTGLRPGVAAGFEAGNALRSGAAGRLQWREVQLSRLGVCWPPAGRIEGTLSGTLTAVEAGDQPRSLEPIRLELETAFTGGHIGSAQLGDCRAVAFLGEHRLLIDKADVYLMGGHLTAWGRLSPHTGTLNLSMGTDFNDVDLNQLAHLMGSEGPTIAGKLSGQGTLLTSTDWRNLGGEAQVNISQSDLGDDPIIRTLYDALSLRLGPAKPEGTGQVNIRFSGSRIVFPGFVYFNRGVEVRGAGQIDDFKRGKASTVQGYAVGSTRVLKDLRLPGISELDRLMTTLQSGAATVVIRGTVGKVEAKPVPLPEVRDALRHLLWQQLRKKQ